jgi:hypothetical protein
MSESKKGEEEITSSSLSLKVPKTRETIINLGVFPFKMPERQLNMQKAAGLERRFTELPRYPYVKTFLHEGGESLVALQKEGVQTIYCNLAVVRNTYVDGEVKFFLDFTHLPGVKNATRRVTLRHHKESSKMPKGMTGTIIVITLPEHVGGEIVIGDASSSLH